MPAKYSVETIKSRAQGSWLSILPAITGIDSSLLDGNHHPCPKCGGHDRFRMVDQDAGALFCNQCFNEKNGDGIAAVAWLSNISFKESCQKICEYLRMDADEPTVAAKSKTSTKKKSTTFHTIEEAIREASASVLMGKPAALWKYRDKDGQMIGVVVRWNKVDDDGEVTQKEYRPFSRRQDGLWVCEAMPVPRTLYNLVAVLAADEVAVCEGEKSADAAAEFGLIGTTCAGGAQAVASADWSALAGKRVVIFPDHDASGESYATEVTKHVLNTTPPARDVRIVRITDLVKAGTDPSKIPPKFDLADLAQGMIDVPEKRASSIARVLEVTAIADVIIQADAPRPEKPQNAAMVVNFNIEEVPGDDGPEEKRVPKPIDEMVEEALESLGGWPKNVGGELFYTSGESLVSLPDKDDLMAYIGSRDGTGVPPNFIRSSGFQTDKQFFIRLGQVTERFLAVEELPHEPPLPGHYYLRGTEASGDGSKLEELLSMFCPKTQYDRSLIMAAFMTPFWGGRGGTRPLICITAEAGVATGKSKLAEAICLLSGGFIEVGPGDDIERIKSRLLSDSARLKRCFFMDNVKSHRFSWADVEALVTISVISGHKLFHGNGDRPNTLTYIMTMNGIAFSRDIASRTVVIELERPAAMNPRWEKTMFEFIETHHRAIVCDILAALRSQPADIGASSRWGGWESGVLAKVPFSRECQDLIADRRRGADADNDEAVGVESYFIKRISECGYDMDLDAVFIPSIVASQWYGEATNEKNVKVVNACRSIKQKIIEKQIHKIHNSNEQVGRGFIYRGEACNENTVVVTDLEDAIERAERFSNL